MIIQDALTGNLHEVPDHFYGSYLGEYGQLYEPQWGEYPQGYGYSPQRVASQVVYDGLGNPVGLLPLLTALAPLAAKVLPQIAGKVLPKVAQRFLPAISSFFSGAPPAPAAGPMMDQPGAPMPGAPIPVSMPAPIHPPVPPVAPPMAHPMMRFHHRRRCRCARAIRRHIAFPPPAVMEPIREAGKAEPAGAVHGWGYYG